MKANNVLSSLNYFSIFFAPFLFPIIVFFITEGEVREHAKKALWTHLIPYVALIVGVVLAGSIGFGTQNEAVAGVGMIAAWGISILVSIYYFIWNIVKGIKVLKAE
ncbi:DUF4870 domain-containing protein [Bacillus manliponensis]|uniref:DUF4870 domain-containing protein n=1 Tax=Bacillus manliponensis TaxID=574376 RepID=UPI0035169B6E